MLSLRCWYYFLSHLYLLSPPVFWVSFRPDQRPDWSGPPAAMAPQRGSYCGPVGVSLKPLGGEKGGRWFSIRSSPPLLASLWGSLTGLIIRRTCRADWQLNEPTSAGLLHAPFHGFSLCMTNPLHRPISRPLPPPISAFSLPFPLFFLSNNPSLFHYCPTSVVLVWDGK